MPFILMTWRQNENLEGIFNENFQQVIESTIPYNVNADFVPASGINFFGLDPSCSADGLSVQSVDAGDGFEDGASWSCAFTASCSTAGSGKNVLDLDLSTISYTDNTDVNFDMTTHQLVAIKSNSTLMNRQSHNVQVLLSKPIRPAVA